MDRLNEEDNEDRAFGPFFHSHRVQIENGIFSSILHIMSVVEYRHDFGTSSGVVCRI